MNIPDFNKAFENINKFNEGIKLMFQKINEQIITMCDAQKEILPLIYKHGWFLDFSCCAHDTFFIKKQLNENNISNINNYLINIYKKRFEYDIQQLSQKHPHRRELFSQIKFCAEHEIYCGAITLVLTNIDGLLNDKFGKSFFITKNREKIIKNIKDCYGENSIVNIFINPFEENLPIYCHTSELNEYPTSLNRHGILHGIFYDYNTELDFFKCFSLLLFIDDVLKNI